MFAPLVLLVRKRCMSPSKVATILVYLNTLPPGAGGETEFNQANVQVPRCLWFFWVSWCSAGFCGSKVSWKMWKFFPRSFCFVFISRLSFKKLKFIKMVSCHSLSVSIVMWFWSNWISKFVPAWWVTQLGEACGWYCGNLAQCFLAAMNSMKGVWDTWNLTIFSGWLDDISCISLDVSNLYLAAIGRGLTVSVHTWMLCDVVLHWPEDVFSRCVFFLLPLR